MTRHTIPFTAITLCVAHAAAAQLPPRTPAEPSRSVTLSLAEYNRLIDRASQITSRAGAAGGGRAFERRASCPCRRRNCARRIRAGRRCPASRPEHGQTPVGRDGAERERCRPAAAARRRRPRARGHPARTWPVHGRRGVGNAAHHAPGTSAVLAARAGGRDGAREDRRTGRSGRCACQPRMDHQAIDRQRPDDRRSDAGSRHDRRSVVVDARQRAGCGGARRPHGRGRPDAHDAR